MKEEIEVKIKKKEINFIVWLLPLVSLFIAGWLVYKYYANLGPVIEIYFKSSGGLEPKKSFLRFRDVKVGIVESVTLLKKGVLVKVRVHKDVKQFLNRSTKFWIVTPTIEVGKIKGLEALITGPFIQMYAKPYGFTKRKFKGLNEAPLDDSILNDKIIKLISNDSYSLSEKMPVYYKSIKVGMIRRIKLLKNSKVEIIVSIKKKYFKYINNSTRFWNIKGMNIKFSTKGLKIIMPGISQLLIGGIEFDTLDLNKPLTKKSFILYESKNLAFENRLGDGIKYVNVAFRVINRFNSDFYVGMPIVFKGFKVGKIKEVYSKVDKNLNVITFVKAKVNINAFYPYDFKELIKKGMSILVVKSGILFKSLDLKIVFSKKRAKKINDLYILPVIYENKKDLVFEINKFIKKLNSLELNETLRNFNALLVRSYVLVKNVNNIVRDRKIKEILNNLNLVLLQTNKTLKSVKELSDSYSKKSCFYKKINELLKEIHLDTIELYKIEKKVDKKPNSLIFGD